MFLNDVTVDYMAVFAAALVYFILGAIWYAPCLFRSRCCIKHDESHPEEPPQACKMDSTTCKIGSYIGEFVLDLVIAYVLAIFIEVSQATEIIEGIMVAIWIGIGFVATTHFSAVLWGRKTLKSFFIHACFMLVGLTAMGATIIYLS
jgi:hypothetical protein